MASGFGKNPKWEDMMQELSLVVGPEVGPLLKLTKNGKTVQDPGLIHEKEMFRDIVKNPEVVHGMFIIYVSTKYFVRTRSLQVNDALAPLALLSFNAI